MPKPLKWGILGAGTRILSKDIHNYILCVVRILMKQTLEMSLGLAVWYSYKNKVTRYHNVCLQI